MKSIWSEHKGVRCVLACEHWQTWPPMLASTGEDANVHRSRGTISDIEHQRMQVWEKVCGLSEMNPDKCLGCPCVRTVVKDHLGVHLLTLNGKKKSRIADSMDEHLFRQHLTTVRRPPGSPGSGEPADWVVGRNQNGQAQPAPPVPGGDKGSDEGGSPR